MDDRHGTPSNEGNNWPLGGKRVLCGNKLDGRASVASNFPAASHYVKKDCREPVPPFFTQRGATRTTYGTVTVTGYRFHNGHGVTILKMIAFRSGTTDAFCLQNSQ